MQIIFSIFLFLFLATPANAAGFLIKSSTSKSVYYLSMDSKRYVFPNDKVFYSWYSDFSSVTIMDQATINTWPIAGNVTYRPGNRLVKITTDPKVYAVDKNGTLRWVTSEDAAVSLYGNNWNKQVDDVPDAFFVNYKVGAPIVTTSDFNPSKASEDAIDIAKDREVTALTPAPATSASVPPSNITSSSIRPTISRFVSDKSSLKSGESFKLSWTAENAVVCALTTDKNSITIPFTGRLPSGEATLTVESAVFSSQSSFTYFAVCADKDWNTAVDQLTIEKYTDRTPLVFTEGPTQTASGTISYQTNKPAGPAPDNDGCGNPKTPGIPYSCTLRLVDEWGNRVEAAVTYTTPSHLTLTNPSNFLSVVGYSYARVRIENHNAKWSEVTGLSFLVTNFEGDTTHPGAWPASMKITESDGYVVYNDTILDGSKDCLSGCIINVTFPARSLEAMQTKEFVITINSLRERRFNVTSFTAITDAAIRVQ